MKIGFVGLGIMGKHMAENLVKAGHELTVYDHNQCNMDLLVQAGAAQAANAAEAAAGRSSAQNQGGKVDYTNYPSVLAGVEQEQQNRNRQGNAGRSRSQRQRELRRIKRTINAIIEQFSDEEDWIFSGKLGDQLSKRLPDFDVRNYGFKKFTSFVNSLGDYEVRKISAGNGQQQIYIRLRNK